MFDESSAVTVTLNVVPDVAAAGAETEKCVAGPAVTVRLEEPELLPGFGSESDVTVAVLVILAPPADELMWSVTSKVAPTAKGNVARPAEIVPVPPTTGVVRLKAEPPLVWLTLTNVVLAGRVSTNDTLVAADGPKLITVMV